MPALVSFHHIYYKAFFKLKAQNALFWLIAPTMIARQSYSNDIEERIKNMWNVHKNRVAKGMGATWSSTGFHESMELQDANFILNNATITGDMMFDSAMT